MAVSPIRIIGWSIATACVAVAGLLVGIVAAFIAAVVQAVTR